jgi:signal transduction histidine kinase/CheY-like chemotaxis protein
MTKWPVLAALAVAGGIGAAAGYCFSRKGSHAPPAAPSEITPAEIATLQSASHELGRQNEVLFQALAEARQASEDKSQFLAKASHEIRNPMNAVLGMTELLLTTRLNPEQREYASAVRDSAASLLSLVNDLLEFSRASARAIQLQVTRFEPRGVAQSVVQLMRAKAQRRGITLTADIDDAVPEEVMGDPGRIRQVLVNLVSNAIRFTNKGGVAIVVRTADDGRRLRFEVHDTGSGIPASDLARIFEPFASAQPREGESSTGLGLSISRQLVESMGGRIEVSSKTGEGSVFSFELPCRMAEVADSLPAAGGREGVRILVADDNLVNQRLALRMLEKQGYDVDVVSNGMEAIKAVLRRQYSLILMDIHMPEMDGLQATDAIRQIETERHTPIVALTASALYDDVRKCLQAGMDDYLSKPFTTEALQGKLDRWLSRHPMAAAISA